MAVPKKRQTRARRDLRRFSSAYRMEAANALRCSNCNAATLSHRVCSGCGHYNGKQVIAAVVAEA